ncbi:MAG: hypothetical protein IJY91_04950, partial [Oscillospiraceae bacterium]|nr:hypothetical protein [Oscillospiraceae bacterium]
FAEDQTEIYVKFVMEHWDTYEGAGIAYSTLTVNAAQDKPEDPGTPVQNTYSFDDLPSGEVTAEDIGAIEESNLYYGKDGVALLSPRNGYEEASATWLIEAAEGEKLENCVLTIVGRTAYNNEEAKNGNYLKVFASTDGTGYTLVKEFRANENQDDSQELTVDLTDAVKGSEKAYVKLQWLVFDAPYSFGIRSVTLTANDAGEGDMEGSDPSLDFDKAPEDCKLIKHTYIFDKLPKGEVSAGAIGAIHESNMYFGIDGVPLLSPRNGYEIASATWLLEAAEGEPLHNCLINIVGRTFYITESVKNDNYLKVYASPDGVNYTLVKEFRANSNPDTSQNFLVDLSDAVKGSGKAYIKLEWLVFDSPHIFGIRGITLVGNSIGKNVSFGIGGSGSKKPVDLSIPHEECMKVELSQNFNTLTAGEVTAEDIGAVDEMNMYFGIDGVPLLSPRNGYEIASATWKLETEGKDPLYDCVLTIVGRTFYVNESVKDDNYLKVYASADGVNYTLVKEFRSNDNPDDTQRFTVDLTDVVKGNGQAYVKLEWLVFDSPHIFGIRSITLTGNTAGIDNSSGASAKVAITNIQNFSQLPVGPADKDALLAHKSANLCYGYNNIGLLTASEAGEDAYVTWVLNAKEGEPFEDCYLTLIGRCGYINQELAEKSEWRIQFSSDGENYSTVTTLKPTEPAGDLQSFVIDLSAQSFGLNKIYVRLYWKSLDDPSGMGLRAMSMVANAGEDYALFTPNVLSDKLTIDAVDPENIPVGSEDISVETPQEEGVNNALVWIIAGGTAVAAVIAAAFVISLKKRSRKKADKKDASV